MTLGWGLRAWGVTLALLALVGWGATSAGAQDGGTSSADLTVRAYTCPVGYDGDTFGADCGDSPRAGVTLGYIVLAPEAQYVDETTGADGAAACLLEAVVNGAGIRVDLPDGVAGYEVGCTKNGGDDQPVRYTSNGFALDTISNGDDIACDLYLIPDEDDDPDPVTDLPSTGAGTAPEGAVQSALFSAPPSSWWPAGWRPCCSAVARCGNATLVMAGRATLLGG